LKAVQREAAYHSWGLGELLCRESLEAAPRSVDDALYAADLALAIGERVRPRDLTADCPFELQMLAHAHRGNALRVGEERRAAIEAFRQAEECWERAEVRFFPFRAQVLSLQASLEYYLRRFTDAIETASEALFEIEGQDLETREAQTKLLCKRAMARCELGQTALALADARQAAALIEAKEQPRLWLAAHQLLLSYIMPDLGQFDSALELLPLVEEVVKLHGHPGEQLRVQWAKARIFAGVGRRSESQRLLRRVQEGFQDLRQPAAAAAVTLELATLYFQEGDLQAVRRLAEETFPVFRDQQIHREALAALALFQQAALTEQVTGTLLSELVTYFRKAQTNPSLRFTLNPGEG
jgi:tetratricopeptide (TPR) repeat protein